MTVGTDTVNFLGIRTTIPDCGDWEHPNNDSIGAWWMGQDEDRRLADNHVSFCEGYFYEDACIHDPSRRLGCKMLQHVVMCHHMASDVTSFPTGGITRVGAAQWQAVAPWARPDAKFGEAINEESALKYGSSDVYFLSFSVQGIPNSQSN